MAYHTFSEILIYIAAAIIGIICYIAIFFRWLFNLFRR